MKMNLKKTNKALIYLCLTFFMILLPGFKLVKQIRKDRSLIVLSFNIHHSVGIDNVLDLQRIANVINAERPDLVALQGVDINTKRSGCTNQMEVLAKLTNMNFVFGKSMNWNGGEYGNGILGKFDIISNEIYPLPGEQRCALVTTLNINDTIIAFVSTHLDKEKEFRDKSIIPIEDLLVNYAEMPLIFAGDLNAAPDSDILNSLGAKLINANINNNTIPVAEPNLKTNYIMYAPKQSWEVVSSKVLNDNITSDYRPIKAILKLK